MDTLVKVKLDELTVGEFNPTYKTYQTAIVVNGSRRTGFINDKKIEGLKEAHAKGEIIELIFYTNGTYENFKLPTKTDKLAIELDKVKAFLKTKFPEDFPNQTIQEPTEQSKVPDLPITAEEGAKRLKDAWENDEEDKQVGNDDTKLPF